MAEKTRANTHKGIIPPEIGKSESEVKAIMDLKNRNGGPL